MAILIMIIRGASIKVLCQFNPLKTNRICVIEGPNAFRAVNTLRLGYKSHSVNTE